MNDSAWMMQAVVFAVKALPHFYLPGMAWCWLAASWPGSRVVRAAGCVLISLLITLFTALALAVAGIFTAGLFAGAMAAITLMGILLGCFFRRRDFLEGARLAAPGFVLVALALVVVILLPRRGEWLVGGWDPGVYVNTGVAVSREGTLHPAPAPVYSALVRDRAFVFTREILGLHEAFPGLPIDPQTGAFQLYFYPATPMLVAVMHRCAGLAGALRTPLLIGWLAVLMFAAMLRAGGASRGWTAAGTTVIGLQPLVLYHLHTPCSEMIELFLVCALGLCLVLRDRSVVCATLAAATMFGAVLNRVSFILFAGLIVAAVAWADLGRTGRRRVVAEHLALILGVVAGAAYYHFLSPVSLVKVAHVMPRIELAAALLAAAALLLDALAFVPNVRGFVVRADTPAVRWAALAGAALALGLVYFAKPGWLGEMPHNVRKMIPYFGWPVLALAGVGLGAAATRRFRSAFVLDAFLLALAAATFVVLREKHASELYPWATKRFLPFTVPLASALAGAGAVWLWTAARTRVQRAVVVVVLAAGLALTAPQVRDAWSLTEYDGVSRPLEQIAARIAPDDVVVADHFWWGTPLMFVYGKQVLNGERIWKGDNPAQAEAFLRALKKSGRRIRFVTSGDEGLAVFPFEIAKPSLDWASGPLTLREIAHHRDSTGFWIRDRNLDFRLYTWGGD